jgi:hypothetical protein
VLVARLRRLKDPGKIADDLLERFSLTDAAARRVSTYSGGMRRRLDGASAFSYPLIFLPFISSAFVPTDTMPGPVRAFAEHQPVTSIVNTIRDLFTQQPVGADIWIALAWCVGIRIVASTFAMAAHHRKIGWARPWSDLPPIGPPGKRASMAQRPRLPGPAVGVP